MAPKDRLPERMFDYEDGEYWAAEAEFERKIEREASMRFAFPADYLTFDPDEQFESRERYLEEMYWEEADREYESGRDAELDLLDNADDDYDLPF